MDRIYKFKLHHFGHDYAGSSWGCEHVRAHHCQQISYLCSTAPPQRRIAAICEFIYLIHLKKGMTSSQEWKTTFWSQCKIWPYSALLVENKRWHDHHYVGLNMVSWLDVAMEIHQFPMISPARNSRDRDFPGILSWWPAGASHEIPTTSLWW